MQPKYKTTSLNTATYLIVKGVILLDKEPTMSGHFTFVFLDSPDRENLVTSFITGHGGFVNVHQFLEAQKQLKNLLKQE